MIVAVVLVIVAVLLVAGVVFSLARPRDDDRPAHVEGGRSFPGGH